MQGMTRTNPACGDAEPIAGPSSGPCLVGAGVVCYVSQPNQRSFIQYPQIIFPREPQGLKLWQSYQPTPMVGLGATCPKWTSVPIAMKQPHQAIPIEEASQDELMLVARTNLRILTWVPATDSSRLPFVPAHCVYARVLACRDVCRWSCQHFTPEASASWVCLCGPAATLPLLCPCPAPPPPPLGANLTIEILKVIAHLACRSEGIK